MKIKNIIAIGCAICLATVPFSLTACEQELEDAYTVTYNLNYEGSETRTVAYQAGRKAVDWNATRDGFELTGWFLDEACTKEYNFNDRIASDLTLYAQWESEADKFVVTFDGNYAGKGKNTTIAVSEGGKINRSQAPEIEKIGFVLEGWYKDADCTQPWDFSKDTVNSDITLYANFDYDDSVERDKDGDPIFTNVSVNVWLSANYDNSRDYLTDIIDAFNEEYEGKIYVNASTSLPDQDLTSLRLQETASKNNTSENYYSVPDMYDLANLEFDDSRWYEGMAQDAHVEGVLHSVPLVAAVPYIVYNKELMQKYNGDAELPSSYSEFTALLKKAAEGENDDSFHALITGNSWPYKVFGGQAAYMQNGVPYYVWEDGAYVNLWETPEGAANVATAMKNAYALLGSTSSLGRLCADGASSSNDDQIVNEIANGNALMGVLNNLQSTQHTKLVRNEALGIMPLSGLYSDNAQTKDIVPCFTIGLGFYKSGDMNNTEFAAAAVFADYASKHTYMMAKKGWYPVEKAATTCDEFVNSQIKSLQYMKELFAQMGDPENFVSLYGHKNGKTIAEQMTSSVLASYLYSDGTADLEEQIRLAAQTLNGQIAY